MKYEISVSEWTLPPNFSLIPLKQKSWSKVGLLPQKQKWRNYMGPVTTLSILLRFWVQLVTYLHTTKFYSSWPANKGGKIHPHTWWIFKPHTIWGWKHTLRELDWCTRETAVLGESSSGPSENHRKNRFWKNSEHGYRTQACWFLIVNFKFNIYFTCARNLHIQTD